ncbi:Autophagy-related protein 13a [Sesamum alatum]|uniref:Autophagy-related protein 13a n=1 Tax=Sesamum alatum TaxID=300844 RepID=A0AAE1YMM5_9LAMI|nr:Autophagy-related protein 13a [Sesamum alatum]
MDLHSYPQAEHGKFEQILNQFLLKSLHIILDSRVPANRPSSRGGEIKKTDKWFNLVLGDRPSAMDSLSFWNRTLMEPMIIDIILVQESPNPSSELATSGMEASTETVVERWMVQYEGQRLMAPQIGEATYKKMYKKSIILLRSVHAMLRLLPAYKAFRKLCSLKQNCDFVINYKVCSFSSPFSRAEEESMKRYSFVPIDVQPGRLSVSVIYREDLSDFNLDVLVSCPPQIITDYVGSPLTEPMRAFPCTPSDKGRPTSVPIRGRQVNSSSPFQRPHSWTGGLHQDVSSPQSQPFSGSPPLHRSPYEYSPSPTETYIHRNQNQRFPTHQKTMSDDLLSPPFSSSPSPSPPTYLSGGNTVQSRLRSETAPVSIPHPMMGRSPRFLSPNLSDPSRHSLPPLSPRNTRYDPSSHESSSGIRSMRRLDSLRAGESSSGPINVSPKVARDTKEDSGRFSSLLSSSSSPRVGFSRSSSRLSFQDDFGDCDFSCPFIVDDVDPPDSQASLNPDGTKSSEVSSQASSTAKKSQDTAVGILVHMLKTAPPLRQDSGYYTSSKMELEGEVGAASEFFKPRKTSDALEELKVYKEMKHLLLSKSAAARLVGKEKSWT